MLNLNCVICAELFSQSDDVHATTCGHMFHLLCLQKWMDRSKSCPQCRSRCTDRNIFRIYFNLANLDVSNIDVGSLQEQLDNAKLQATIKEKELIKSTEQVQKLKETQKKCMKTISGLEQKLQKNDFLILSYSDQIKQLKSDIKLMDDLRKENKTLKRQIEIMEGVSSMINGTADEVDKLLKIENDPRKLSIIATTLRRELRACENKKTDLRNVLKVVQTDFRKEIELKKTREDRIVELESENYELTERLKKIETEISNANNRDSKPSSSVVNAIKTEEKRLTISPTIKESVKKIEESSSPYLNIKSSSVGLLPLFKRTNEATSTDASTHLTTTKLATIKISPLKNNATKKVNMNNAFCRGAVRKTASDLTEKYSIFKKPRLGMIAATASAGAAGFMKPIGSNYVSNGFGGLERADPFAPNSDEEDKIGDAECGTQTSKNAPKNINSRLKAGGLRNFKLQK